MSGAETDKQPTLDQDPLTEAVIDVLRQVYDPELPVTKRGFAYVQMTLTAPGCPVAETFPGTVETAIRSVPDIVDARVDLVWDPPWSQDRMSDETKLTLGLL